MHIQYPYGIYHFVRSCGIRTVALCLNISSVSMIGFHQNFTGNQKLDPTRIPKPGIDQPIVSAYRILQDPIGSDIGFDDLGTACGLEQVLNQLLVKKITSTKMIGTFYITGIECLAKYLYSRAFTGMMNHLDTGQCANICWKISNPLSTSST